MAKPKAETVTAFKAMNAGMTCRGHKFEVGQTYAVDGETRLCENGFHACGNPLDVLNYYDLCGSRFARVTLSGDIRRESDGSKLCGASVTIDAELTLAEWVDASVKWLLNACKGGEGVKAASGDYSKLAASGYSSQLAASGDYSKLAASGDYSKLAASGDSSQLEINGKNSAAATAGYGGKIKAADGCPIAICEYDARGKPIGFATGVAGRDFPADTWMIAKDGKLVEAQP